MSAKNANEVFSFLEEHGELMAVTMFRCFKGHPESMNIAERRFDKDKHIKAIFQEVFGNLITFTESKYDFEINGGRVSCKTSRSKVFQHPKKYHPEELTKPGSVMLINTIGSGYVLNNRFDVLMVVEYLEEENLLTIGAISAGRIPSRIVETPDQVRVRIANQDYNFFQQYQMPELEVSNELLERRYSDGERRTAREIDRVVTQAAKKKGYDLFTKYPKKSRVKVA